MVYIIKNIYAPTNIAFTNNI